MIDQRIKDIWAEYLAAKSPKDYTTLYIHVPFCSQKCNYCEYFSKVVKEVPEAALDYLEAQFAEAAPYFKGEPIKAINFGGGTPNMLSPKQLKRALDMIQKYWNLEIGPQNEMGFEFNPYHLSMEHIDVLKNSYVNRLSMGVQSFNKEVLEKEHRLYTSPRRIAEIYAAVKSFAQIVNVDLLAGLYGQNNEILLSDAKTLLDIGVESLTIYELNRLPDHDHNNNFESTRIYITGMLMQLYRELGNAYPNYTYIGTTENGFMHCNRFYKKVNTFENFYNPAPQGYNNVVAFSTDDDRIKIYPYSHFIPINKAYQRLESGELNIYEIDQRKDRSHWLVAKDRRT